MPEIMKSTEKGSSRIANCGRRSRVICPVDIVDFYFSKRRTPSISAVMPASNSFFFSFVGASNGGYHTSASEDCFTFPWPRACDGGGACLRFLLIMKYQNASTTTAKPAIPPTTPPAIAPVLLEFDGLFCWGFVVVLADVGLAKKYVDCDEVEMEDRDDGFDVELFGFTDVVFPSTIHTPLPALQQAGPFGFALGA